MEFNKKHNNTKADYIREMLLKTAGNNPDLFSYFVNIQEAKELLGQQNSLMKKEFHLKKEIKKIVDC